MKHSNTIQSQTRQNKDFLFSRIHLLSRDFTKVPQDLKDILTAFPISFRKEDQVVCEEKMGERRPISGWFKTHLVSSRHLQWIRWARYSMHKMNK